MPRFRGFGHKLDGFSTERWQTELGGNGKNTSPGVPFPKAKRRHREAGHRFEFLFRKPRSGLNELHDNVNDGAAFMRRGRRAGPEGFRKSRDRFRSLGDHPPVSS